MEENRIMLAMLHHRQHRVTPSSSNNQNLGGTERHFYTRSESEGRKWPAFGRCPGRSRDATSFRAPCSKHRRACLLRPASSLLTNRPSRSSHQHGGAKSVFDVVRHENCRVRECLGLWVHPSALHGCTSLCLLVLGWEE
jgi:hypothetical protein